MPITYTQRLAAFENLAAGVAGVVTVPLGKLWVVRNMSALLATSTNRLGFVGFVVSAGNTGFWKVGTPHVEMGKTFLYEGRAVVYQGEELEFYSPDGGWSWEASGYAFDV